MSLRNTLRAMFQQRIKSANPFLRVLFGITIVLLLGARCQCVTRNPGEISLIIAGGHTRSVLWIELLSDYFAPEINQRLKSNNIPYTISWTEAYGGSVAKLGGMLEAIEEGLVDMGFVATVFDASKMPLQNVSYMVPFGSSDARVVTKAVMELEREIPAMAESWHQNNMRLLSGAAVDNYDLYTTFPVKSLDDLRGRKILAPGPAANWVRGTGAVGVSGTLATYYNDLKTGVADGALTLASGCYSLRLHEVVKYMTKVDLGAHFAGGVAINLDTWETFPPVVQRIFEEVSHDFTTLLADTTQMRGELAIKKMVQEGLILSYFSEKERQLWADSIPNTASVWSETHELRGLPARSIVKSYINKLKDFGVILPRDWSQE